MKIEIVSHCYASGLPHYASALCYQLSSLVLHTPRYCNVTATICFTPSDTRTVDVLKKFDVIFRTARQIRDFNRIELKTFELPDPHLLGRRAIGRNVAALSSHADIVWFADVDQVYHGICLDRLSEWEWTDNTTMIFPRIIKIHKDHKTGDCSLHPSVPNMGLVDIDPSEFVDKTYNRAIGGVQIVHGDFARKHGYLNHLEHWLQGVDQPFSSFRDDIAYRSFCASMGQVKSIDLPGMFRLRHSTTSYR